MAACCCIVVVRGVVESDRKPDVPVRCDCGLDGDLCGSGSLSEDGDEELDEGDEDEL